jgi:hypothetical protein
MIDVCLRQVYPAGERLFVDYAGMTMRVTEHITALPLREIDRIDLKSSS